MPENLRDIGLIQRRIAAHARRVFRKHRFATQTDMARAMGVNQGHLSAVLAGQRPPGLEFLIRLADVAHESLDYICFTEPLFGAAPSEQLFRPAPARVVKQSDTGSMPFHYYRELMRSGRDFDPPLSIDEYYLFEKIALDEAERLARDVTWPPPENVEERSAVLQPLMVEAYRVASETIVRNRKMEAKQTKRRKDPPPGAHR